MAKKEALAHKTPDKDFVKIKITKEAKNLKEGSILDATPDTAAILIKRKWAVEVK